MEVTLNDYPKVDTTQAIDPEMGINMSVLFAETDNCNVTYKNWMEKFGEWKHTYHVNNWKLGSTVTWNVTVKETGTYHIDLTYSGQGRLVWGIYTDEGYTIQNQQNSSHIYTKYPIGWIKFDKPGKHTITAKLVEGDFENASLTHLSATPVGF